MLWGDLSNRIYEIRRADGRKGYAVIDEDLVSVIRSALTMVEVDEEWYFGRHPHVAAAVSVGEIASAREHFIRFGYFEGKLPRRIHVDEAWYLEKNLDVAEAVAGGAFESGQEHFEASGAKEGRLPYPGFTYFPIDGDS